MPEEDLTELDEVLLAVGREVQRAEQLHAPLHSPHEAFAVILEELEEFKAEVWKKQHDQVAMYKELIQLGAMAVRAILNLELSPPTEET